MISLSLKPPLFNLTDDVLTFNNDNVIQLPLKTYFNSKRKDNCTNSIKHFTFRVITSYFFILFKGTKTGKALKYVRNVFSKRKENRENVQDVILLITDGRAYDRVDQISKQIRDEGTEVSVLLLHIFLI